MNHIFSIMVGWESVEIKGPEAKDFLQRLTSADFRVLKPGSFNTGMLLQPTGKIIAYFKTLCLESANYLLLVPTDQSGNPPSQQLQDSFEKMHFREDLTIRPLGKEWIYLRVLGSDEQKLGFLKEAALGAEKTFLSLQEGRLLAMNEKRWSASPLKYDIGIGVKATDLRNIIEMLKIAGFQQKSDLEPYRVRAGDPGVPAEVGPGILPLEAQLDDAVHENKGCYPGQEVIERIRSMGQVPRKLALLGGKNQPPEVPAPIFSNGTEAGVLTSAQLDPFADGWVGLGFIKRIYANLKAPYLIGNETITVRFKNPDKI